MHNGQVKPVKKPIDLLAEADLSRFDKEKTNKKNNRRNSKRNVQPRHQERSQQLVDTNEQKIQPRQRRSGKPKKQPTQQRNQQPKSTNENKNE